MEEEEGRTRDEGTLREEDVEGGEVEDGMERETAPDDENLLWRQTP